METQDNNQELEQLFNTVVDGGYCIGCGGCAALYPIFRRFSIYFENISAMMFALQSLQPFECQQASIA